MGTSSTKEETNMESTIQEIISGNDIVVFSSRSCPYCQDAIRNLKAAGFDPTVVEATSQQRSELYSVTTSRSVPNVWIKGKYVGGCNDGPESWMGINKILRSNKMDEFLA